MYTGHVKNLDDPDIKSQIIDVEAKKSILCHLRDKFGAQVVLAIGDGANDIPMLREATHGIAFGDKENVRSATSLHLNTGNLLHVLNILGI